MKKTAFSDGDGNSLYADFLWLVSTFQRGAHARELNLDVLQHFLNANLVRCGMDEHILLASACPQHLQVAAISMNMFSCLKNAQFAIA